MATLPPVRCSDALRDALEALAVAERRNVSEIIRFALEGYLGLSPAGGVTASAVPIPGETAASARGRVDGGGGVEPDDPAGSEVEQGDRHAKLPRRRLARTGLCEHRVPATSFCKVCDV